jgi:hypothetical protein
MARSRTVAAAAIFLFGTTFLWFMPSFLGTATTWWRGLALGGSIVGVLVLVLWWLAVGSLSGVTNRAVNLGLHAIGIAVLPGLLLVASLGRGIDRRLAGQPRRGT